MKIKTILLVINPLKAARLFILFFFLSCYAKTHAQAPSVSWQYVLGGTLAESSRSFQKTSDGGYIVGGFAESKDGDIKGAKGGLDLWVIKFDASGGIQWKKNYGGTNDENGTTIIEISNGVGFILGGVTASSNGDVKGSFGGRDAWIVRIDLNGNVVWQKALGGGKDEWLEDIKLSNDGNLLVTFYSVSTNGSMVGNHGAYDVFAGKLSITTGAIIWRRILGGSSDDAAYEIQPTSDGGCVVSGITYSNDGDVTGNHGINDVWIVKLKNNGDTEWSKVLGGSDRDNNTRVQCAPDGSYFVVANTSSINGDVNKTEPGIAVWMLKLSAAGEILNQHIQQQGGGGISDLRVTPDGGVIVAHSGTLNSNGIGPGNLFQKFNSNLVREWIQEHGGAKADYLSLVQPLADGSYISIATSNSDDIAGYKGGNDIWILKLKADGTKDWERLYGGTNDESIPAPVSGFLGRISVYQKNIADDQGNIFFAASTYSNNTGDLAGTNLHYNSRVGYKPDIWVIKLSPTVITSSLKTVSTNPKQFGLSFQHSAYPNPFKHKATIAFTAEQKGETTIEIFNAQGIMVKKLKPGNTQKGSSYNYEVNLSGLPAGNYIYKLINGKNVGTGTLIKMN